MKYKIEPAIGSIRTNPTHKQRTSALFSESPVVAGQTLRRGQSITLDDKQMAQHESHLKRLVDAGSIKITPMGGILGHSPSKEPVKVELKDSVPVAESTSDAVLKELAKEEVAEASPEAPVEAKEPEVATVPPPPPSSPEVKVQGKKNKKG